MDRECEWFPKEQHVKKLSKRAATQADLLDLDRQLCFALYAATRAVTKTYRDRLEPLGLTYPQFLVLISLWEQDGLTISGIGDRLMLDSGTLTPLVKRLEAMGHVRRQRSTDDEREVRVHLTKEGHNLRIGALEARKFIGRRFQMSEDEIIDLRADIMALIARLDFEAARESREK